MKMTQLPFYTLIFMAFVQAETAKNIYIEELTAFKTSPDYQLIFNEDANPILQAIERDIENCQHLSWLQRLIRSTFLSQDVIVVTPKTMPKLYSYIEILCKTSEIKTPTVFLTREKGLFNAAAQKLLMSTGAIIIGQKLLLETSDKEFESIIAHEIGHIKYNHVNKTIAINFLAFFGSWAGSYYLLNKQINNQQVAIVSSQYLAIFASLIATSIIINKRFEKEADEFAYKGMNKGEGLAEFFKHLQVKEETEETDFNHTSDKLKASRSELSLYSYAGLSTSYFLAKLAHKIDKAYRWFYHNTPFCVHASPEERIKAVREYLDSHTIVAQTA
ncbi:MAG: M48 family metalloprotease [Candidatus Babeliaceae bacterium]|nr:M48 family metalloprotease [Candidatus Babeliaceae bacterium]